VLSVFVGIRPLVKSGDSRITAALSRDHTIHIDASGLLTTTGGKWTTYRKMAEDTVNQAAELARLPEKPCVTKTLNIHGFHARERFGPLSVYGSDALAIQDLDARRPDARRAAAPGPALLARGGRVGRACREMARTGADARAWPPRWGLMARELGWSTERQRQEVEVFTALAAT
jgi:glycerol-3-phosphate dehydrogenase